MDNVNNVTIVGIYREIKVTETFTKQALEWNAKDRTGTWKPGTFDIYLKEDLKISKNIKVGSKMKISGWLTFNFFTKQDGSQMTFPKLIVSEVLEVEEGNQTVATAPQPFNEAPAVPNMSGNTTQAPAAPTGVPTPPPIPGNDQPWN